MPLVTRETYRDGVLVSTDQVEVSQESVNADVMRAVTAAALAANRLYLTLPSPTSAQNTAQVQRLTRQNVALTRMLLGLLDGTD